MIMPFGKYKGICISEIPNSYIVWLLENSNNLDECLESELKECLVENLELYDESDLNTSNIKKIFRDLTKKYHPDTGGNNIAMRAILEFYNFLKD